MPESSTREALSRLQKKSKPLLLRFVAVKVRLGKKSGVGEGPVWTGPSQFSSLQLHSEALISCSSCVVAGSDCDHCARWRLQGAVEAQNGIQRIEGHACRQSAGFAVSNRESADRLDLEGSRNATGKRHLIGARKHWSDGRQSR